jgi:hypothetical protein
MKMRIKRDRTRRIKAPARRKIIPNICSWCNRIYDLKYWKVEPGKRTGASHGICPECLEKNCKVFEKWMSDE